MENDEYTNLADVAPHFAHVDDLQSAVWLNGQYIKAIEGAAAKAAQVPGPLRTSVDNFFMTDAISRASPAMAKCVVARQQQEARP